MSIGWFKRFVCDKSCYSFFSEAKFLLFDNQINVTISYRKKTFKKNIIFFNFQIVSEHVFLFYFNDIWPNIERGIEKEETASCTMIARLIYKININLVWDFIIYRHRNL